MIPNGSAEVVMEVMRGGVSLTTAQLSCEGLVEVKAVEGRPKEGRGQ